jgi:hypothetical protein
LAVNKGKCPAGKASLRKKLRYMERNCEDFEYIYGFGTVNEEICVNYSFICVITKLFSKWLKIPSIVKNYIENPFVIWIISALCAKFCVHNEEKAVPSGIISALNGLRTAIPKVYGYLQIFYGSFTDLLRIFYGHFTNTNQYFTNTAILQ